MTDFYTVVHRAISALPDKSGPNRRAVYDKARKALLRQLQSFDPPLPSADVTSQRLALEDAIRKIESEIARNLRTRRAKEASRPESPPPASRETQRERPAPADDARPSRRVEAAPAPVPAEAVAAEATSAGAPDVSPPEPPSPEGTIEPGGRALPTAAEAVPADAMTPLAPGNAAAEAPGESVEAFAAADVGAAPTDDWQAPAAAAAEADVPPPRSGGFDEPGEPTPYYAASGDGDATGFESSGDPRGDLGPAGGADDEDVGQDAAAPPQPPRSPEERRQRRRRRQARQQREQAASETP